MDNNSFYCKSHHNLNEYQNKVYLIPAFVAVFALAIAVSTPYVMADDQGLANTDEGARHWGSTGHKGPMGLHFVTVEGFTGTISLPDTFDKETHNALKDKVSVSLFQAASAAQENGMTNANSAHIGLVQDEQGNKYLAWIISGMEEDSGIITVNTFVVDAGNSDNTAIASHQFDPSTIKERFGNHPMPFKANFGDLDEETKAEVQTAFQNLKNAKISGDQEQIDQAKQSLKSLFESIKTQN